MHLVDPAQRDAAIAALEHQLPQRILWQQVIVRPVRWDYGQLYDWYRYLEPIAYANARITQMGIDVPRNRIVFGVLDETWRERLTHRIEELGVPCLPVSVEVTGPTIIG